MVKQSVAIVGYVPRKMKRDIDLLQEADRRLSISRMIEEAMADYIPKKMVELGIAPETDSSDLARGGHGARDERRYALSMGPTYQ